MADALPPDDQRRLAESFVRFADRECGAYAPAYDRLARIVARVPDLLAIAETVPAGRAVPNTFLGAVHLLFGAEMAAFSESEFIAACLCEEPRLRALCATKLVQTNEVRRSSALLPGVSFIADRFAGPLALIEPGASAGLLLRFDRYRIDYGGADCSGPSDALVSFACEVRGIPPPIAWDPVRLVRRMGIDLQPVRPDDAEAVAWLRALVWPDHPERRALLDRALADLALAPVEVVSGDAMDALVEVVQSLEPGVVPIVFHFAMLAHFTAEARERFVALVEALGGASREGLAWLRSEAVDGGARWLDLDLFLPGGRRDYVRLARIHPHGEWIEWLANA